MRAMTCLREARRIQLIRVASRFDLRQPRAAPALDEQRLRIGRAQDGVERIFAA